MTQKEHSVCLGKPVKSYRIIIQQRKPLKKSTCRSFMIYDFSGKSNIDNIKTKLERLR